MRKNRGISAIPALILVILVVLVGAYFVFANSNSDSELTNDNEIVSKAIENSLEAGSYVLDADISLDLMSESQGSTVSFSGDILMNGYIDYEDISSPNADVNIRIPEIKMNQGGSANISFGPINVDMRLIDDVQYLRINEANLGFIDISSSYGTWVMQDPFNDLSLSAEDKELMLTLRDQQRVIATEVRNRAKDLDLYSSITKIGEEDLDGVATNQYALVVNGEKVVDLIEFVFEETAKSDAFKDLTEEEKDQFNAQMEPVLEMIGKFPFDKIVINQWVEKKDLLTRKTVVSFDLANLKPLISELSTKYGIPDSDISGKIDFSAYITDYGVRRDIMVPVGAISIQEFVSQLYGY